MNWLKWAPAILVATAVGAAQRDPAFDLNEEVITWRSRPKNDARKGGGVSVRRLSKNL